MIVAVAVVHVVKVAVNEVVDVVTMRHRVVPAVRAVNVAIRVAVAPMARRTRSRVGAIDRDRAFVNVVSVDRVQVAIVQIVDAAIVLDGAVPAVRPVNMLVVGVSLVLVRRIPPGPSVVSKRYSRCRSPRRTMKTMTNAK